MTVKEAIEYIISKSKDDESLLTDTGRFWAFLTDLAPEHRKELNVIKRSLDSDFLNLCFKDKEEIKRRVSRMKYRLEGQGVGENWIDFIIDSFFAPLGWEPTKDEEETPQVQPQQTQKQQNWGVIVILIFIGICIFTIFSNSNNRDKNKQVTYSTIETADVGDYIKFGNYPQTSSNGGVQPIEWRVLAKEDNRILVISRYGLDANRFDPSSNVWKNSEIRKWLNNDFYNEAFTEKEKKYISSSNLSDVGTTDNVFFLSYDDVEKYFANNEARRCKATDYAKGNGAYVWNQDAFDYWLWNQEGCGSWWLRSPSPDIDCYVYGINAYGNLVYIDVSYCGDVVRPALWINLHSLDRG